MKKGIITFQNANNYGAVLQAFALKNFLDKVDICGSTEVINYESKYLGHLKFQEQAFKDFIYKHLNLTKEVRDEKGLKTLDFNLFITGSDQVFNPLLTGFDDNYFLTFTSARKISYAGSLGVKTETFSEYKDYFRERLAKFHKISIREETHQQFLENLGLKAEVHVDPSLLLTSDEYFELLEIDKSTLMDNYILLFTYSTDPKLMDVANMLSLHLGLPIISISLGCTERYLVKGAVSLNKTDPETFIKLIAGASLVLTESFHGLMFSMVFHRPFLVYVKKRDTSVRLVYTLKKFGLTDRTLKNFDVNKTLLLDYTYVDSMIQKERDRARRYLKDSCEMRD